MAFKVKVYLVEDSYIKQPISKTASGTEPAMQTWVHPYYFHVQVLFIFLT